MSSADKKQSFFVCLFLALGPRSRRRGETAERCSHSDRQAKTGLTSPVLFDVHRDRKDYYGRKAQDGHLDFHTTPELCLTSTVSK